MNIRTAQILTGFALVALIIAQWAIFAGPLDTLDEQAQMAGNIGDTAKFAGYAGLHTLVMIAMPLMFGAIGLCVIAVYETYKRLNERQARLVTIEHKE